jgi:hypothetical protein
MRSSTVDEICVRIHIMRSSLDSWTCGSTYHVRCLFLKRSIYLALSVRVRIHILRSSLDFWLFGSSIDMYKKTVDFRNFMHIYKRVSCLILDFRSFNLLATVKFVGIRIIISICAYLHDEIVFGLLSAICVHVYTHTRIWAYDTVELLMIMLCMYVCIYVCIYVQIRIHTHVHTHTYIYIYIYIHRCPPTRTSSCR